MGHEIKRVKITTRHGEVEATAWTTSHPNLFITPYRVTYGQSDDGKPLCCFSDDMFVVTHVPTGYTVFCDPSEFEVARKCAEVYATSGIPWEEIKTIEDAKKHREAALKVKPQIDEIRYGHYAAS